MLDGKEIQPISNNTNITYKRMKMEEYSLLYKDQLQLLALKKCLYLHDKYFKSQHYEENYAQGELIDHRNKHIEACLDQVYDLHEVFIEEMKEVTKGK